MPAGFNGTGTYVREYGVGGWVIDKGNSVPITASRMDTEMDAMATALSTCITKDGQTTITANLPMNSKKFTGLAVGSARTDSITLGQVQDGQFLDLGTTGGAADAYTASPSPAITAYAASMLYVVKISATNLTTTPYLQISGIATPASTAVITKLINGVEVAVQPSDMVTGGVYFFKRNTGNTGFILLNPEIVVNSAIDDNSSINNLGLAASVAANALTIALKTKAGTDATTSNRVKISFRNATAATGTYVTRTATAAASLVVSSGSTLGTSNGIAAKLYVYALDNAGTIELGVSTYLFADNSIQSSTAEGGAGAADSGTVLYSTTARSNVAVRLIGLINITQATAGTWVTSPSTISLDPLGLISTDIPYFKSTNGYTYLQNGLILQWGRTSTTAGTSNTAVALPITYPNAHLSAVGCALSNDVNEDASKAYPTSTSQITVVNGEAVTREILWWSVGH